MKVVSVFTIFFYLEESIEALERLTIFTSFWKDAERPEPRSYPPVSGQTIQFAGSLLSGNSEVSLC